MGLNAYGHRPEPVQVLAYRVAAVCICSRLLCWAYTTGTARAGNPGHWRHARERARC